MAACSVHTPTSALPEEHVVKRCFHECLPLVNGVVDLMDAHLDSAVVEMVSVSGDTIRRGDSVGVCTSNTNLERCSNTTRNSKGYRIAEYSPSVWKWRAGI